MKVKWHYDRTLQWGAYHGLAVEIETDDGQTFRHAVQMKSEFATRDKLEAELKAWAKTKDIEL